MRTFTAKEIEKLPSCLFSRFSYCPEEKHPDISLEFCLEKCTLPDLKRSIMRENIGAAMEEFDTLVHILTKMGVFKDADNL